MQTENTYVEIDLGNIALNPRGEYSGEASYEYLDTVSCMGGSYVCLAELTKTISGIAPEEGKNTEHWQMLTLPGGLTSDYIAMHDDVVNKAKQVETSRAAVELSQQEVEDAQADVSQMRQDTQEAAEEAASSRDSAAGYAQSAETSRAAAKESEDNINAQMTGFDTHVAKKISEAESAITEARRTAVSTVSTKQDDATQAVTDEGDKQMKNVEDAGTEQVGKVKSAGASAVSAAGAAEVSAVNAVKAQQTASIKAVADEGTQQVTAVNTAGSTQVSTIETEGADQVKAIQEAGENALQNISNGVDKGLSEEGKAADAKATGEAISKLTEDFITTNSDNASYKEKVYDGLVPNSYAVLVNTCITISKVLKTFLIKSIKLYVKSSTADTITVKLLKEPKYGSEAYFETAVDVEANTDKLVEIKLDRIYYTGETLNILTESKKSLDSGKSVMYCYNCETGNKLGEYLEVEDGIYNKITYSSAVGFSSGAIYYRENIVDTLYNTEQALYNTLYNTEQTPFNGTNSLLKLYLDSFFVKAQTGKNLAIKNKFIARLGTFANDTAFKWKHDLDPRYGTLFLPAIKEGYSYTNLGGSGLGSFCVLDKTGKVIRGIATEVRDVRHYVYEEGDFLVAFESPFLRKTDKTNPIVVAGQVDELTDAGAYEYAPVEELNNRIKSVEDKLNNISPDVSQLDIMETSPIYSVYNDVNPSRSYATTLWIDHLINDSKCFNKDVGFTENKNKMLRFGALQFAENEKAKEVKTTLPIYSSDFIIPSTQITHRCSKLTSSNSKFPKILDIGDSVTDGYLASHQKYDNNLPSQYWSWVKYFFALDAKEDANDASKNNCKMLGITSINGKKYGSSNSFVLNGTIHKNYAVGKGGWSAEDLNLKTFQTEDNLNPFFDEKTSKFSLKAAVDKFKTLADDGVTRLEVGSTAGTEVTDVNAFDFCTPTHVVINLNHNSSLEEYKRTIPEVVNTIKSEYPNIIVILMSIDETGTYFPCLYPNYSESDIAWKNNPGLHNKNLSIYQYIKESLEDEANNIYVCSGHLVQHPVKSYPSVDNILPETIGGKIEYYGNHSDGSAPNYHPNNIAHKSWGYQLYSLIKYTLAKD